MSLPPNLDSLLTGEGSGDLKFVFVGGKGGVGKTTSSSAIATLLATRGGKRTLLVSTDPAHSLGDAFQTKFSNTPTSPGVANLDVVEIDPTESMREALEDWSTLVEDLAPEGGEMKDRIGTFQEWLSGIPGIDEATALSQAITHIESGKYDVIVFDTAPTGHTLKLLALPEILQAGITKLQSWQSTLHGYWDAVKGLASTGGTDAAAKRAAAKEAVSKKLQDYKEGIQKVALMLRDQRRTRFVVVCIAEFLSVAETKRLLSELKVNGVRASHIVVNQLVTGDALSGDQLEELEALAEVGGLNLNQELLRRTVHACRLTTSRRAIQTKYLDDLRGSEESKGLDGLCEVPLLPEEVTGADALRRFAGLLVGPDPATAAGDAGTAIGGSGAAPLYGEQIRAMNANEGGVGAGDDATLEEAEAPWEPNIGDAVKIQGLAKSAQYNGLDGVVSSKRNEDTGRYGMEIEFEGKRKVLALQLKNLTLVSSGKKAKLDGGSNGAAAAGAPADDPLQKKIAKLLEDPEIKALVEKNPKYRAAVEDCLGNPMNAMKYFADPEMSPLVGKIMAKM